MTQRMKATKPIEYRGKTIKPGEVFPVKSEDVNTFNVQQSAVLTDETETKAKRQYTRKAPIKAAPKTRVAARKAGPTAKASAKVAPKRRYNRRDMQAR